MRDGQVPSLLSPASSYGPLARRVLASRDQIKKTWPSEGCPLYDHKIITSIS